MNLDTDALETRIEREMHIHHLPGFALAVVRGEEVVYSHGFGVTSVEGGLPVTPETLFCIGSISKSLTALTVMRLVESELLDLDTPVVHYVPWLTFSRPEFASGVTLRRLLSHSSGLFGTAGNSAPRDLGALERFIREAIPRAQFVAEPGKVFEYSSLGIDLAGYVAEVVTGRYFPAVVRQYILDPLGLDRTTYDRTVAMTYPVALPHVIGGDGSALVQHRMFDNAAANPAGMAMSTVSDLARIAMVLLNQGHSGGQRFLWSESVAEMLTPQISLRDRAGSAYGLGFWTLRYKSLDWITHAGLLDPYLCELSIFPQAGVGVVFACNATTGFDPYALRAEVVDRLLDLTDESAEPVARASIDGNLSRHAGTYVSLAAGVATVRVTDGGLALDRPGGSVTLRAVGDHTFSDDTGTVTVGFVPEPADPSQYFMLDEHAYQRVDLTTLPIVERSVLVTYVGVYRFDDGDTVTVRLRDDRLVASFSWLPGEHACLPLDAAQFVTAASLIEFQATGENEHVLHYLGYVTARRVSDIARADPDQRSGTSS